VINVPHYIQCLSCLTCYVTFLSSLYGSLTLSWSDRFHISHVIKRAYDIMSLVCHTALVPFMSYCRSISTFILFWAMSHFTCDKFITCNYMPFLYNLLCPFHVVILWISSSSYVVVSSSLFVLLRIVSSTFTLVLLSMWLISQLPSFSYIIVGDLTLVLLSLYASFFVVPPFIFFMLYRMTLCVFTVTCYVYDVLNILHIQP
jgi:hypothetical protein